MTDRPLPEAVEKALVAFSDAVSDMENGHATNDDAVRAEDALRAAIDAALAPGEPVAWGVFNGTSFKCAYDDERAAREDYQRYAVVPLYAAPPALPASVERRMAFMEVERAVAEEREACAEACDRVQEKLECSGEEQDLAAAYVAKKCAAAIRARGGAK